MVNMRSLPLRVVVAALLCTTALLCSSVLTAQRFAPTVRIVNRIDESSLVTLKGNTNPFANAKNDRGLVSPSLPMTDLILVLSRDPAQQAAFDKFVASQYDPNSPNFHQWLTPDQVGANFGPSETDIATVTNWLTGHGFTVSEVTKDRMSIRFNGTAAQVQSTFHTEIHNLLVHGVQHIGNMSNPQIPSALGPVVVGIKALHNFFPRPLHRMGSTVTLDHGTGTWQRAANPVSSLPKSSGASGATPSTSSTKKVHPEFTINVPPTGGSNGTPAYTEEDISPYDFATIYNILPLWNKGIDGTGQTIAIAGTSDINQNDISTFRTFFGLPTNLPANTPQIVHPNPNLPGGDDPGICTSTSATAVCGIGDLVENSLDVEWSGSIAKNAQIVLVTAASQSSTDDTLYDAESFIVNNVTAHILSVSYGECELGMGTSGNAEYNTLWQNAAAEGIAVFVSSGDSGSASCDDGGDSSGVPYVAEYGLSVSGIASTPYNTAVGGTDFNWCPFTSTTACPAAPYWNTTNASNGASAVGYVPEMPWNDTCTNPFVLAYLIDVAKANNISGVNNAETACNFLADDFPANTYATALVDTVGGGGGMSNCTVSDGSTVASCTGGYARPSWQSNVTGIPGGSTRLIPDVSFFSSDGFISDSAYLICVEENGNLPCTYSNDAEPFASEVGGTSASTPPMAGVMALINQKTGAAQGFANTELYKLAAQQSYSSCSAETVTTSSSCYFNDIDANTGGTLGFSAPGTNAMPCDASDSSPNCVASNSFDGSKDEIGILTGYNSGTGYDLATGLGSLNVANVVNAWPSISGGTAVTVTVTPAQTSISSTQTLGVTGAVASSPTGGVTPTGTVTLTAGSYTAMVTLSSAGGYSFTVPANSLGAGTDTVNVAYSGDTTYSTGDGSAILTVNGTGATFSLTPTTPAAVAPGASASSTVTVAAVAGYMGSVTATCSLTSSPQGATDAPNCTGGGSGLAVNLTSTNTSVPLTFTVTTTAPGVAALAYPNVRGKNKGWLGAGGGAVLAFLVFLGIPARRRSWRQMLGGLALIAALGGLSSCGGGGSSGSTTPTRDPGTSAGSYTFTVQGVGNPSVSPAVSATFTVTVN